MKYFFPILALLLSSCSPSFYCRKCSKLGGIKSDSIKQTITITTPAQKADSTIVFGREVTLEDSLAWMSWGAIVPRDTVIIREDSVVIKLKFVPGPERKIYVSADCPEQEKSKEVVKTVINEIQTEPSIRWKFGAGALILLALVVGFLLRGIGR